MDLSPFEMTDTDIAVMAVRNPDTGVPLVGADGKPVTISFVHMDSLRYRVARRALIDAKLRAAKPAGTQQSGEEAERTTAQVHAIAVVAWQNIGLDADQTPCTPENVIQAFQRLPWLQVQVDAFTGDRANFKKASPKP